MAEKANDGAAGALKGQPVAAESARELPAVMFVAMRWSCSPDDGKLWKLELNTSRQEARAILPTL